MVAGDRAGLPGDFLHHRVSGQLDAAASAADAARVVSKSDERNGDVLFSVVGGGGGDAHLFFNNLAGARPGGWSFAMFWCWVYPPPLAEPPGG